VANKPRVATDVHVSVREESASLHNVTKLNVSPYLALGTYSDVVINVESAHRIKDHIASDPTVSAYLQGLGAMGK
jgi:hypothetical protein